MFYFLVFLIPFLMVMSYLIVVNNRLKNQYLDIVRRLYRIRKEANYEEIDFPVGIKHNMVVTSNAIKRLEKFLMALEDKLAVKRTQVVSNAYKPRKEKLDILAERTKHVAKKLAEEPKEEEEEVMP